MQLGMANNETAEELLGREVFERDLLLRLCASIRAGCSWVDNHAVGRSGADAQ